MVERVAAFIREKHLLSEGDRVVAGVSGGADSVCLFHVLVSLRQKMGLTLHAVHVHHGIRGGEADRDAAFVERLAAEWDVPCVVVREDVPARAAEMGLSEEEAGRLLRYAAFRKEAERMGGAKIAVGHHKEDQAETILHNLFRGSALKGLSGMSAVSGDVIRPLLCVGKSEILSYIKEHGLTYCEDSTNACGDYTRNRIRRLLPEICREVNAGAVEHILAAGEKIAQADAWFEEEAERIWAARGVAESGRCGIEARAVAELPEILAGYLILRMIRLRTGSVKDITSAHVEAVRLLAGMETGKRVCLPYGLEAVREYRMLWLKDREIPAGTAEAAAPGGPCAGRLSFSRFPREKNQKIPENRYTKWLDYDKIKGTLSLRTRQPGDYITLKGGGRKSLKSFFIDEKIPRGLRDRIPVLAEENHVLWIVGYRISEYYKITETTKEILQAQADGGEVHGRQDPDSDPGGRGQ